jgi:signal transduction histidine kinase
MLCYLYPEPTYLIFSNDLPALLYYSHIPTALIALLIALLVFISAPRELLNRLLCLILLSFTGWVIINLLAWTLVQGQWVLFLWSLYGMLQAAIALLSIYFVYAFVRGKPMPSGQKIMLAGLAFPVIFFAASDLNLSGFNISWCDAFGYEGQLYLAYYTALGALAFIWIGWLLLKGVTELPRAERIQRAVLGLGIEAFLLVFFGGIYFISYLAELNILINTDIEFYTLFSMTFFMSLIAWLIVKFKTFNVGTSATSALIVTLLILTGSQFTYIESRTGLIITSITLVLTSILSVFLYKTVRAETEQRKQLQVLTTKLEKANVRLKTLDKQKSEFVSIASHQLRSPLTSIRGYASMLSEGSFGKIPEKAKEPLERIETSAKRMALAVEDYLNVSRIESGNMKYELADFNLKDEIERICDDVRPTALKSGLVLLFRTNLQSKAIVHADVGKTVQMAHNLINNSVKYTKKGSVTVFVRDDVSKKQVYVDVIDTGVGMSQDTIDILFQKFSRAEGASKVNTTGTGLGLFVAYKMATAMSGDITAHSEGEGKGSRFTLTLPLAM